MTTKDDNAAGYFLANRDERERLEALEAPNDAATIERLDKLGVAEGWRYLEDSRVPSSNNVTAPALVGATCGTRRRAASNLRKRCSTSLP